MMLMTYFLMPLIRRSAEILIKIEPDSGKKKTLINECYDIGILSSEDVARLYSEYEIVGKDI